MAISTDEIRVQTGEFDLELIHVVDLSSRKLVAISLLQRCSSLILLDLSCNLISDLQPLSGLQSLEILILNSNSISDINPLSKLFKLYSLQLSGNYIESSISFLCLGSLYNLKNLVINDMSTGLTNPLCRQPDYFTQVIAVLPLLNTLDRIQVRGKTEILNRSALSLHENGELEAAVIGAKLTERMNSFEKEFALEKDRVEKELGMKYRNIESHFQFETQNS